ncbi:proton-coupled folate transporter [Aplysia californica]|uniref:Proton-coupled folate transporter n=1 Tax=Aplysia californica TaxID=6500 RepID=A0ABM0JVX6_APLCA|nr:proton-coupled folate transporter [Aplysia californica]
MPRVPVGEGQPLLQAIRRSTRASLTDPDARLRLRATVLLPCVITAYFILYVLCHSVLNPYIYDKIASEYPSHSTSQKPCSANMTDPTGNTTAQKIQEKIEKRVSTFELYLGLTGSLTACLPVLFLGPLSDRFGRRIGFLFPIIGTMLKCGIYALVIGMDLSMNLFFLAHVAEALGGSFAAMLTTMFSVISDVTVPGPRRSIHITSMEAGQTLVQSFTMLAAGQGLKWNMKGLLIIGLGFGILAVILAVVIPETLPSGSTGHLSDPRAGVRSQWRDRGRECLGFLRACFAMPMKSLSIYVRGDKVKLTTRRLAIVAFILTVAVNFSKPGVWTLYLMKWPLCWSASELLTLSGTQITCNWIVILLVVAVLQKVFKMADRQIVLIGCVSSIMSAAFSSVAINDRMVYEVAVLSVMIRVIIPMLRSILSCAVDVTEQGAMYSGLGFIETLAVGVFGLAANRIYYATVSTFAGAVFVVCAALMFVALVVLVILNVVANRDRAEHKADGVNGNIQAQDADSVPDLIF